MARRRGPTSQYAVVWRAEREAARDRPHHQSSVSMACDERMWSAAREHDARNLGAGIDLRPMPRFEHVKDAPHRLRSHIVGNADVQVGVEPPPDEQKRHVGASELEKAGRVGRDLAN